MRSPTVQGEIVRALTANGIFLLLFMIGGCASFQANTDLGAGRAALLRGMPLQAIPHFERAIAADPTARYSTLQESGWTYLGRANYEAKRYGEARKALQRAVEINRDDGMALLFLGLTLARLGDHTSAKNETLGGLRLLEENLNYILFNTSSGPYWDPSGKIRRELAAARKDAAEAKSTLDHLLPRLENIGASLEEEIDLARRDESFDNRRNSGGDM